MIKKISKILIAAAAISTFALPTHAANFNPQQKTEIEEIIHQYLLKKPEVLVEVMQILQRKQYEEAQQVVKDTQKNAAQFADHLFNQKSDPVVGNPNAKKTIVEFFDYQCAHCVTMGPVLDNLVKSNPNIRIVYKEFPIRGPMSEMAAKAALAAHKQGKYNALHQALLTSNQPLSADIIFKLAKSAGVNVEQLKKDMNSSEISQQIQANIKLGQDLKLLGTPAFFIGNAENKSAAINYVPGEMSQKQLQEAAEKI